MIGIVMAGGHSTRLGQDKARLTLSDSKKSTLLDRTATLLKTCTQSVFVSCRTSQDVFPWPAICDEIEGAGPAGGILSVLHTLNDSILVLSCDLPFMHRMILNRLLAARIQRHPDSVMTAFQHEEDGHIEPLVAIYEPGSRIWFEKAIAAGQYKLGQIIPEEHRTLVPCSIKDAPAFFNINTPRELKQALLLADGLSTAKQDNSRTSHTEFGKV